MIRTRKSGSPMRYGGSRSRLVLVELSPISWLDPPGDLVRLKFRII